MIQDIDTRTGHGVRRICEVLGLSRSSFYHAAKPTPTQRADEEIGALVEEIFRRHKRNYGYRRIAEELRDQGVHVSNDRIRRIMKTRGLIAIQPKNFIPRTSDGRADKPSKNLLADGAFPEAPNQAWAGDITYIPTTNGWLYLAIVIDLFEGKVGKIRILAFGDRSVTVFVQCIQMAFVKSGLLCQRSRGERCKQECGQ